MKPLLVPCAVVPGVLLALVTALRAWLEVQDPDGASTRLVSANVLCLLWLLGMSWMMLRRGLSLGQGAVVGLLFLLLYRLPIGAVYALAWSGRWTVAGTDTPVRYVTQVKQQMGDGVSTSAVFLGNGLLPVPFFLVFLVIVWALAWACCFRGKRPFAGAAPAEVAQRS